jgi:hypothetical protein
MSKESISSSTELVNIEYLVAFPFCLVQIKLRFFRFLVYLRLLSKGYCFLLLHLFISYHILLVDLPQYIYGDRLLWVYSIEVLYS